MKSILYLLETFPQISSEAFILSEINGLKGLGNEIYIVAFYKGIGTHKELDKYNILDNVSYNFLYKNKFLKLIIFLLKLLKDLTTKPNWTFTHAKKIVQTKYELKYMIYSYLTLRNIYNKKIDLIQISFADLNFMYTAMFLSSVLKCYYSIVFRAVDIFKDIAHDEMVIKNRIVSNANQVITISRYNKAFLEKKFKTKREIENVHDAIDPEKFTPCEQIGNPKIVTVARFIEKKGIEYLLKAYNILALQRIDFDAVIIGEGELELKYRELIKNYNIEERISIKTSMSQEKIIDELKRSMIFVLPCVIAKDGDRDILPNVLKEAMSMEIPVITSDIVPSRDSQAIADSIAHLINDKELRIKLGRNARKKIIKDFNIENKVKKLNDIFDSLMLEDRKSC